MKNIKIFITILVGLLFIACSNDEKVMISANPTAPVLAQPSHATTAYNADSSAYVLSMDSSGVAETFISTAADYSVNIETTYSLEIDKSGNNFANAQVLTSGTTDTLSVTVSQLYNMITGSDFNATVGVTSSYDVRMVASIGAGKDSLFSNVITIKINPLPSLKPYTLVTPNLWYIIGLGDGNWNYSNAGIGASMFPLSLVKGNAYNSAGDGTFTYTGYFQSANGFKIVSGKASDMGTWTVQWGSSDGGLTPVFEDGSSSNFTVPSDGYYTITLNSITNTLSIVAATAPTSTYTNMVMSGDFNSWSSTANPASAFLSSNNHQWYATITISADGGIKFNNNNWANSWGDTTFPNGIGTNNGPNIPIVAGTYIALFNDIDDCYFFIKQ